MRSLHLFVALLMVMAAQPNYAAEITPTSLPGPTPPSGEDAAADGSNSPQRQDPDTGADVPNSAAEAQARIAEAAAEQAAMRAEFTLPDHPEALLPKVLDENLLDMQNTERARAANGLWDWQRSTPALDIHLGVGTSVNGVDYASAYPNRPEVFRFVTGGKNRLAGLNKSLKRASKWMNKHTCGGFNWTAQFQQAFRTDALVEYLKSLPEGVAAALPMALIGAFSPQLAEIVKHLKLIAGFDISATKADCHAIENALTTGMNKDTWATGYSECLQRNKPQGVRVSMEQCKASSASAAQNSEGNLVGVNTSQAGSNGWLSSAYSYSKDSLGEIYNRDAGTPAQTSEQAARTSSTAQGGTGEGTDAEGTANALNSDPNARSLMSTTGSAVESLGRTLFGSVRIHGNGSLEVGRKSIALFNLRVQSHSARLHETLIEKLRLHYLHLRDFHDPLVADRREALAESYRGLKIWTYHARGGHADSKPWLTRQQHGSSSSPITDETMDSCAYIVGMLEAYADNPPMKARLVQHYPIGEFLTALARYEVFLWLEEHYRDVFARLMAKTTATKQAGADQKTPGEAQRRIYEDAMKDLNESLCHVERTVLELAPRINRYRPAPRSDQLGRPYLTAPSLTTPGLSFPAE